MRTIYLGGKVFTGALPLTEAFIVEEDKFLAAGTDEEMLALRQDGDVIVPLRTALSAPASTTATCT